MIKKITTVALLATLAGCAPHQDNTLNDQVKQFRETRNLYNAAFLRCDQIVYEKYHGQLYGNPSVEGAERKAVSRAFYAERGVCTDNYGRKMTALWNSQPPAVKAFYEQRRTELHNEIIAIEKEAKR